jgi:hypothetical protein
MHIPHWIATRALLCAVGVALFGGAAFGQDGSEPDVVIIGDMVLDRALLVPSSPGGVAGPASHTVKPLYSGGYWPGGIIPVEFESGISNAQQALFWASCAKWSRLAAIMCTPRQGEASWLSVRNHPTACDANVGFPRTPPAVIRLVPTCWHTQVLVHEIGHVLGFLHEHQRADRDEYVTIDLSNVQPGQMFNIVKSSTGDPLLGYDFLSIMHGPWNTSSIDFSRPTIIPKRPEHQQFARTMGSGDFNRGPSAGDGQAARAIYGAPVGPPRAISVCSRWA